MFFIRVLLNFRRYFLCSLEFWINVQEDQRTSANYEITNSDICKRVAGLEFWFFMCTRLPQVDKLLYKVGRLFINLQQEL